MHYNRILSKTFNKKKVLEINLGLNIKNNQNIVSFRMGPDHPYRVALLLVPLLA